MKLIKYGYLFLLLLVPVFLISQSNQWVTPNSGWKKIGNIVSLINGSDNVEIGTLTISTNLLMDNDVLITRDVNSGLTASTTQTQAGGLALTAQINDISVIANDSDAVTLPSLTSTGSLTIFVLNDDTSGSNVLQIFPASGDNLGAGLNISLILEVNESVVFTGVDATDWHVVASTEIAHAEMQDTGNTDAFVINDAGGDAHVYHSNGLAIGDLSGGWTFDAGGAGTSFAITKIADSTGGKILVTTASIAHGLAVNDIVSQTNLSDGNYVGIFKVLQVPSDTTYTVTAAFASTGTGTMDQAATLTPSALAVGTYLISYSYSTTTVTNNETIDFDIFINTTSQGGGLRIRNKFGTGTDFNVGGGTGLVDIESGDKISLCIQNNDSAGNITIRNFGITLIRL